MPSKPNPVVVQDDDDLDIFEDAGRDYVASKEAHPIESHRTLFEETVSAELDSTQPSMAFSQLIQASKEETLEDLEVDESKLSKMDRDMMDMDDSDYDGEMADFTELNMDGQSRPGKRLVSEFKQAPSKKPPFKKFKGEKKGSKLDKEFDALGKVYETKYGTKLK